MKVLEGRIIEYINVLYSGEEKRLACELVEELYRKWDNFTVESSRGLSEKDCILITYGDSLQKDGEKPLQTLGKFWEHYGQEAITNIHLLPVFPYTSDDGFSVSDYGKINPALGGWKDIEGLSGRFGIMMDAVINHTSKSHRWFQKCCQGETPYVQYYIECDKDADYSDVTRPRALPLLTEFETPEGRKCFWTTFSDDQIDLNFKSPYVMKEIAEILLLYASKGARFLRLDAVGFAWKELGTACMHLKETHVLIKLLRYIVQRFYPGTVIVTETNVPHLENISYFGDGDEAQMVYQFPLPPLTLYTMLTGNCTRLSAWAKSLDETPLPEGAAYFNFLASHDGIGVRPVDGILNQQEKDCLFKAVLEHGGRISYKQNPDGSNSPYELNINYLDAVASDKTGAEMKAACFLASQAIMLSLQGVPGIYYHSLLGSVNWQEGVEESGIARRINREKLKTPELELELETAGSLRNLVYDGYMHMLKVRGCQSAFSPYAKQRILDYGAEIFALERENEQTGQRILSLINISDRAVRLGKNRKAAGRDILWGRGNLAIENMEPYQVVWLELGEE